MLLSEANIQALTEQTANTHNDEYAVEQSKLDRIKLYIEDQKQYIHHYKSPNHHYHHSDSNKEESSSVSILDLEEAAAKKSSHDYSDDGASLFSASISQVMSRKRQHQYETAKAQRQNKAVSVRKDNKRQQQLTTNQYQQQQQQQRLSTKKTKPKQDGRRQQKYTSNNKVHHNNSISLSPSVAAVSPDYNNRKNSRRNRKRPTISRSNQSSDGHEQKRAATTRLPQTHANGFNLLQKFTSPNLEISRITMKSNNGYKRPSLGLFNKGKSSAKATKAVPDLVFSESKFLTRSNNDHHNSYQHHASPSYEDGNSSTSHRRRKQRQPSISRFFQHTTADKQHHENQSHATAASLFNTAQWPTVTAATASRTRPPQQIPSPLFVRYGSNSHLDQNKHTHHTPSPAAKKPKQHYYHHHASKVVPTNPKSEAISLTSSNESIENLLKECKDAPQVVVGYHLQQQEQQQQQQQRKEHHHQQRHSTTTQIKGYHNNESQQQRVPTYSRVKTPNIINKMQQQQAPVIVIESSDEEESSEEEEYDYRQEAFAANKRSVNYTPYSTEATPPPSESSLLLYYKSNIHGFDSDIHSQVGAAEEIEEKEREKHHYPKEEEDAMLDDLLYWQVQTVASFDDSNNNYTTTALNDYYHGGEDESIALKTPSPPHESTNRFIVGNITKQQQQALYEHDNSEKEYESVVNFWKYQYKRAL